MADPVVGVLDETSDFVMFFLQMFCATKNTGSRAPLNLDLKVKCITPMEPHPYLGLVTPGGRGRVTFPGKKNTQSSGPKTSQ